MDGYVQHAYIGNKTVIDIDEETSKFTTNDGRIKGTVSGTITKEYSGKTDNFSIELNNVPFYSTYGDLKIVADFHSVQGDYPGSPSYNVRRSYEEFKRIAWDGVGLIYPKYILVDYALYPATIEYHPWDEEDENVYVKFTNQKVDGSYIYVTDTTITIRPDEYNHKTSTQKRYVLTEG